MKKIIAKCARLHETDENIMHTLQRYPTVAFFAYHLLLDMATNPETCFMFFF